jgi:hypothetical protein
MNKRDMLLKKAKRSQSLEDLSLYKKQRNKVVNLQKSSHNKYLHDKKNI